jgi:hypothetical protein
MSSVWRNMMIRQCVRNILSSKIEITGTHYETKMRVCCVVANYSDIRQNKTIQEVFEYTSRIGVTFAFREYNSSKYSDDRDVITNLPAFHIYFGSCYFETFYPDSKLLEDLDSSLNEYQKRKIESKVLKEKWSLKSLWKSKIH